MKIKNLENEIRKITERKENFSVLEYIQDASVSMYTAQTSYFMSKMNVHRRQVLIELDEKNPVIIQSGAMQWMAGDIHVGTGVKGVGDFVGKMFKGAVTKESAIKLVYSGTGLLALEPTYKYIILMDVGSWGRKGMTIEDGLFYACSATISQKLDRRKNLSSTALGGEGFFNLSLVGNGVAALESNVPYIELVVAELNNEELKIDGNLAMCWSSDLDFTVERTTKTLIGSAASGEGFVNVYRGTGKVLFSPVAPTSSLSQATNTMSAKAAAKNSNTLGKK